MVLCYNCDIYILMKLQKSYNLVQYNPSTDLPKKKKKEEKKFMVSKCIIKVYVYNRAINFSFFSLKSTLEARLSFIQHWRESLDCKLDFES